MDFTCHAYNITLHVCTVCLNSKFSNYSQNLIHITPFKHKHISMNYFARDLCIFKFSLATELNSLLVRSNWFYQFNSWSRKHRTQLELRVCSHVASVEVCSYCIRFAYDSILYSYIQYYLSYSKNYSALKKILRNPAWAYGHKFKVQS